MTVKPLELGHLDEPPIVEVVCGVKFAPVPGLDPIVLGAYWKERAADFPGRQVHEPLRDNNEVVWAVTPLVRFWFVSPSGEFLLQLQHDRFFLNWRRLREGTYPRFSDSDGQSGVLSRMLREFETFGEFCERTVGARPVPVRCELAKIDHFVEGKHWRDLADLAKLLPWLETFAAFSTSDVPGLLVQFTEPREGGSIAVTLRTGESAGDARRVLLLDTRMVRATSPDQHLSEVFTASNLEVNRVFERLVPAPQRGRFMRPVGAS